MNYRQSSCRQYHNQMDLIQVEQLLRKRQNQLHAKLGVKQTLQRQFADLEGQIQNTAIHIDLTDVSGVVLASAIERQQGELKEKIEKVVTQGLRAVFQEDYSFVLNQSWEGNQPSVEFCVSHPRQACGKPIPLKDAKGGGLVQVVAFLLRVVILLSARPSLRHFLALDEPLSMVSDEYRNNLASLIPELAERTGIQFLINTHDQDLAVIGDVRYRFSLEGGETKVEEIADVRD